MTSKKVTTQKLHTVLQNAGFQSSFYKPSQRASRQGYSIHVSTDFYEIIPNKTVGQTAELLAEALNDAGIDTEFVKDMLKVQKFQ